MSVLSQCPHCRTHVRATDAHCPFCGGDLRLRRSASARLKQTPTVRAMAAALVGLSLAGCEADSANLSRQNDDRGADTGLQPLDSGPTVDVDASAPDLGGVEADLGIVPLYGISPLPRIDAGAVDAGNTELDADLPTPSPLYGIAPPPRDAGVNTDAAGEALDADLPPVVPLYGISPPPFPDAGEDTDIG